MVSIQKNLTFNLVVGAVILLLVAAVSIDRLLGEQLRQEFDDALLSKAGILSGLVEREPSQIEFDSVSRFMPEFESREPLEYYELRLKQGGLIDRSPSLRSSEELIAELSELTTRPRYRDIALAGGGSARLVEFVFVPRMDEEINVEDEDREQARQVQDLKDNSHAEDSEEVIYELSPAEAAGDPAVAIALAKNTQNLDRLILMSRTILGVSFLLLIAGVALLARIAVRRGLTPLTRLGSEVQALDADRLFMRVHQDEKVEELEPITRQLNSLLDRLDRAFQREKRFSGDVAHELKTPISELRTMSEVGREWASEREMVEGFFGDLVDLADDMDCTVTNLLTLAHLDAGNQVVTVESVNLCQLVEGIWKRLQDEARKRRISLDSRVPAGIEIKTDRVKLNLILVNIISNAISYGAEGSTITVVTVESGGTVRLSVTNVATDLAEQDLEVMLERFWRKDQSRTGTRHAGLGLSLVKELATVLNLQIKSLLDGGSRFTMSLYGLARA